VRRNPAYIKNKLEGLIKTTGGGGGGLLLFTFYVIM